DSIGKGERIYAVRFLGPIGYVVTYRNMDPLFVLDLSDPDHPKQTGELTMPGFSTYLHDVGNDQLLGVGQAGDGNAQVSLFDIRDPSNPLRRANVERDGTQGGIPVDPHAFLWWAPESLAVVPINSWSGTESGSVLAVRVHPGRLHTVGVVSNPSGTGA